MQLSRHTLAVVQSYFSKAVLKRSPNTTYAAHTPTPPSPSPPSPPHIGRVGNELRTVIFPDGTTQSMRLNGPYRRPTHSHWLRFHIVLKVAGFCIRAMDGVGITAWSYKKDSDFIQITFRSIEEWSYEVTTPPDHFNLSNISTNTADSSSKKATPPKNA